MKTVSQVIKFLMREEPYYGMFACGLAKEFSDKIPTAGVTIDGINFKLVINKDFWYKLSFPQRCGVLKHELLHLAFFHVLDRDIYLPLCENDPVLMNLAMDMEVQSYVNKEYRLECDAEKMFQEYPNIQRGLGTKFYIEFLKQVKHYNPKNKKSNNQPDLSKGKDILDNHHSDHNWGTQEMSEAKKD